MATYHLLKTTVLCSVPVPEDGRPVLKCQQGHTFSGGLWWGAGGSFLPSPASGDCHLCLWLYHAVMAFRSPPTPVSAPCVSNKSTWHWLSGLPGSPGWPHLESLNFEPHLQGSFPAKVTFAGSGGLESGHAFFGSYHPAHYPLIWAPCLKTQT